MERQFSIIRLIDHFLTFVNSIILMLVLAALIVILFTQVVLRNFFHSGIGWADIISRHLVLWIGFVGATIATRREQHISIDALAELLPERWEEANRALVNLISFVVCTFLTYAAVKFVLDEKAMGGFLYGSFPAWAIESIIPVSFFAISIRFALCFIVHLVRALRMIRKGRL